MLYVSKYWHRLLLKERVDTDLCYTKYVLFNLANSVVSIKYRSQICGAGPKFDHFPWYKHYFARMLHFKGVLSESYIKYPYSSQPIIYHWIIRPF